MRFADEALIEVSSGKGGDGSAAFRREKYAPRGGPSGGDGGRGGAVIFVCRNNLRTLSHLRYTQKFRAEDGANGAKSNCNGRKGGDVSIPVPPGTVLKDANTNKVIHDFGKETADFLFLKGGNGGWGNVHFKTSVKQAPQKALKGLPGESAVLKVELQIIADIGFVGFPNAGKSSLLDCFTNARPKIAPYPFTTKIPNLGVLFAGGDGESGGDGSFERKDIILADIPGLIEGASGGAGLGIRFLKHIERTGALAFLIDLSSADYLSAFDVLLEELKAFSPALTQKRRIIAGSKLDVEGARENLEKLKEKYREEKIIGISVFSREGLKELKEQFLRLV